ncbi:MAG: response regulator transcription factor [Saprospiraceae bacterium]|jgi:DNA-binding NarL/FixJ family response regulator
MINLTPIKIIIADDHDVIIDGLTALLSTEKNLQIVGRANNGKQLLEIIKNKPVDLIILDIEMPEMNGVEVTEKLKTIYPELKILVLTMYNSPDFIANLLRHGVDGYILKNSRKNDLLQAINSVVSGRPFYAPEVTEIMMDSFRQGQSNKEDTPELTQREIEIVRLIAEEYTSREIGEKLFISFHTVERHRKNIIAKLGVKNVAGLVKYALKNGLSK